MRGHRLRLNQSRPCLYGHLPCLRPPSGHSGREDGDTRNSGRPCWLARSSALLQYRNVVSNFYITGLEVSSLVLEYIRSDLFRYAHNTRPRALICHFFRNRSFRYSVWFRLCSHKNRIIRTLARIARMRLSQKTGIQIPAGTKIGYGLYIGHSISVVLHPHTIIGDNCNLSQFTTIGSNKNSPAIIGDNVYIGPGCSLVENVRIGDNVIIGAGSVVVRDIPANCTAAGNPSRIISDNSRDLSAANLWKTNAWRSLHEASPDISR